ncbi:MAG TPA: hypothetical protein VFV85_02730 [Conexibacter sp.]|nr:hypothetical protein [Conexibacter sp.]
MTSREFWDAWELGRSWPRRAAWVDRVGHEPVLEDYEWAALTWWERLRYDFGGRRPIEKALERINRQAG